MKRTFIKETPELFEKCKEAASNWRKFPSFGCHFRYEVPDANNWCISELGHRDEDILTKSNREVIEHRLEEYGEIYSDDSEENWMKHQNGHWAVGHTLGVSFRVFHTVDSNHPAVFISTPAQIVNDALLQIEDYCILDEGDYSEKQIEVSIHVTEQQIYWALCDKVDEASEYYDSVYEWLDENELLETEDGDEGEQYPSEENIIKAAVALGFIKEKEVSSEN